MALDEFGAKPALLVMRPDDVDEWSYQRLAQSVARLANGLAQAGVRPDQRVALFADNCPEWFVACLAILRADGVAVPLDAQFGPTALAHALRDSEARFIFSTTDKRERLEKAAPRDGVKFIFLDADKDKPEAWQKYCSTRRTEFPAVRPNDTATIFYTSGTTGKPKGVPLSHANLAFQLNAVARAGLIQPEDRLLLPLPLHHVYPFVFGVLMPMWLGVPVVLPKGLTGPEIIRALRVGEVTALLGVPRLYRALFEGVEGRIQSQGRLAKAWFKASLALSLGLRKKMKLRAGKFLFYPLHRRIGPKMRVAASGGAALEAALAWKLEALGWQIAVGYGLTETAPLLTLNPPGKAKLDSVGRVIPGVELRIDPAAQPNETDRAPDPPTDQPGVKGEVLARGPNVFCGYLNLPDENQHAFTGGWFRTGDLGFFDSDHHLHLEGRASTLIVAEGGENIQPDEVEDAYATSEAIREIGVLQRDGKLAAVVVPEAQANDSKDDEALQKAVRDAIQQQAKQLPSYQRLSEFVVSREPLARTRLGKIRREELIEHYDRAKAGKKGDRGAKNQPVSRDEMSDADRALLEHRAANAVWSWLTEHYAEHPLSPDSHLQLDLGLDSMGWLNLTLEIGARTGVELDDKIIAKTETVRDLLRAVSAAATDGEGKRAGQWLEKPEAVLDDEQKRWLAPLHPVHAALASAFSQVNRAALRLLFRVETKGANHLPAKGPFVLTPNHTSYLDPFLMGAALNQEQLRHANYAGWTRVAFANPLNRFVCRLAQAVPIDPERAVISSLALAVAVLRRERILIWFPEGRRSPDGKLMEFKSGIGMLLEQFEVPVVPVFIHGASEALPMGRFWPRFRKITVEFGVPKKPAELRRQGKGDNARSKIVTALREQVAALGKST